MRNSLINRALVAKTKLFNYALLAAALLVGVNVNAQTVVTDEAELVAAFANATDGAVIQLGGSAVDFPITTTLNIALTDKKAVTLDLNGHNLVMTDDVAKGTTMIIFTQGNLTIKNDRKATGGAVKNMQKSTLKDGQPTFKKDAAYIQAISVKGSTDLTAENHTVLTINPEVTVEAVEGKIGIIVDGVTMTGYQYKNSKGADSDFYSAFGVVVTVWGKVHGEKYGLQVSGNVKPYPGMEYWSKSAKDSKLHFGTASKYPIVNVESTAEIWSNPTATTNGNGMYIGGYAKVTIKGYVHGSNGVYVKSGDVDIIDAVIKSDNPNTEEINGKGSGTAGCGNAIVIESNAGYSGATDVTISGDTKVEAIAGYAIQEITTTSDTSKLEGLHIEGGTFIGGSESGTIASSTAIADKDADEQRVTVTGGSFDDDKADGLIGEGGVVTPILDENGQEIGSMITTDPNAPTGDAKTAVTNKDLNQYIGKKLSDVPDYMYWTTMAGAEEPAPVVVGDGDTLRFKNFIADWGKITVQDGGTLIIDNPATDDAKMLIMGTAVLTLEPGAKMISKSSLGVETGAAANLIIGAQEGKMAQFLYSPLVNQGRHPKATVEYHSKAKNFTAWDRFGFPDYRGMCINQIKFKGPQALSYIYEWDNVINDWKIVNNHSKEIAPFTGLTLTNNSTNGGIIYQFPCEIVGNINASLDLVDGWNSFSNSYTAIADVEAYLKSIREHYNDAISAALYIYKNGDESSDWEVIGLQDFKDGKYEAALAKLDPMQAFLIKKTNDKTVRGSINYEEQVWNPANGITTPANNAPRQMMDMNKAIITLTDAQGKNARLTIREAAEFSAEYDNGADIAMYENANRFNFYAATDFDNQCQIATDNIEGQVLTLATKGETSFTMSFSDVRGEKMALVDNMTGDVIEMAEGVTYNFIANANEVSERFTVVAAAQAPTALKKAEASAKAAKFINNGQVILQNNGRLFNVLGTEVK